LAPGLTLEASIDKKEPAVHKHLNLYSSSFSSLGSKLERLSD